MRPESSIRIAPGRAHKGIGSDSDWAPACVSRVGGKRALRMALEILAWASRVAVGTFPQTEERGGQVTLGGGREKRFQVEMIASR